MSSPTKMDVYVGSLVEEVVQESRSYEIARRALNRALKSLGSGSYRCRDGRFLVVEPTNGSSSDLVAKFYDVPPIPELEATP